MDLEVATKQVTYWLPSGLNICGGPRSRHKAGDLVATWVGIYIVDLE